MTLRSKFPLIFTLLTLMLTMTAPVESAPAKKSTKRKSTTKKITITGKPPAPKPVVAITPVAIGATFEERLGSLVNSSVAANSIASIQVIELDTGRVVAQRNPDLAVAPASNMKLFTTGAALDLLTPKFEFMTTIAVRGNIDATGTLTGDVKITGRGDPTIGGRFHDGKATAVLQGFASDLQRAGVKTVTGSLILEYGYFDTEFVHPTWPPDQLTNWYEAPIAALSMQEGTVMVRVLPGLPGGQAVVRMEPPNGYMMLLNSAVTARGRGIFIGRKPGTNQIVVRGGVPARSGATEVYVTVPNPLHYFANVAHNTFSTSGINFRGGVRLAEEDTQAGWRTISTHKTPLTVVTYVINKVSQNHYAEQLVKTLGAEVKKEGSWSNGAIVVQDWMYNKVGVPTAEFRMTDGSGMSRFNQASASAFTELLRYMWRTPYRREFVSSMPYTGEPESRLRRRLNQPPYARQVYAKTGYISGVIGLSGYVHAQSGKIYAFSFLFNRYRTGVWGVYRLQDEMLKEIIRSG